MFDLFLSSNADSIVSKPVLHCSTWSVGVGIGFVHLCHDVYVGIPVEE